MKRKKIAVWTGGAIAALLLLSVSAAFLIQRKTFVHRYLLAKMIQIGENSSGTDITIRDYAIRWLPLHVRLQGVIVRGSAQNLSRPLAELPQLEIGIAWGALLHKRVDLTELILDRPAINIAVDQGGRSNLPAWPASTSAPSTGKMQVSIEHAAVRNGELWYNDSPRKVDADLADFHLDASRDATGERYSGNLGYSKGEILIDGYKPLHHDAQISFAATTDGVTFEKIHISTKQSQFNATGIVRDYANPAVEGQYEAHLSTAELHEQLPGVPLTGGEIELAGALSYEAAAGSGLRALRTSGHLSSKMLRAVVAASVSRAELNLRSLVGEYSLEGGNLHVTALQAETMGGSVRAELTAERLTATPSYQVLVSAESLSLGEIGQAAGTAAVPLRGTARIQARAHWIASLQNMVAHADAEVSAAIDPAQYSAPANAAPLPVNADLHVTYDAPHSLLTVAKSTFSSNQTSIVAAGTISDHSALSVRASTSDLHETDLLVAAARDILSAMGKTASSAATPLNLHGRASLEAQMRGRIQDPRITGHAEADALEIRQAHWPHMQADFEVSALSASLKNGLAQSANHGQLNFALSTSLQHWSYTGDNPVALQLQASQIPAADLEQLTGVSAPISGMFSGNLTVRGVIDNPAGEGTVELRNGSLWGEPVRSIAAQFRTADKTLSAHFSIAAPAGNITGEGEFGASNRHYQISISHSALNLGQIRYLSSRGYAIAGTLGIDVHGRGTLGVPQLDIMVGGDQLTFRAAPLGSLSATAQVANQQVNFAVTSTIAGGQINAKGRAGLAAPYMVHGGFEIRSLEFGPLLATYLPSARKQLEGTTEVRGEIEGPLAHPEGVKASVELSKLNFVYQNLRLASVGPVRLNYVNSALTISQAELKGTGTDFKLSGTLPLRGSAPLNISTTGQIDLKLLTILGSHTQSSGTLKINVTARGALKQPQVGGTIELAGASFANDVAPIGVENVDARIAVANNRLTIETLSGKMSGGSFSASGFASYSPASFSLQVNGKSVRVRYPEGTRAQLDANLTLIGTPAASTLNGRVTIDGLSFTPDFDLANFIGQFTSSTASVPPKWEENMRLDVAVASSQDLALSSSKLSLQGSANLRVAGTLSNPVVLGRTILSGGELFFMGNRYQVQSGTVVFANPVRTEPTLNLYVATVVQQYNITLNFLGPLDRLRTNYTSDPALPPVDIIHLLAFGKTTEESAATARPAALGAESVIANGLTSQVSSRIEKLAGISQLQIDPSLGGNNSNPGARVAIQQRLTSTILFTFATDLTDTQNAVAQVKYQTRGRLSFSLTRDEYGSFAIEAKIRKKF